MYFPQIPNRSGLSGTLLYFFPRDQKKSAVSQGGPSLRMENDPSPIVNGKFKFEFGFLFFTSYIFNSEKSDYMNSSR